jgi:putative ABC transport system permease protein
MIVKDLIFMSIDGMRERKTRVFLNVLGIMIGIAAMTALISITMGMSLEITQQLDLFGPKTITVTRSTGGGQTIRGPLTLRDVTRIESISGVALASPLIQRKREIHLGGYSDWVVVRGVIPEDYTQLFPSVELTEGRFLQRGDRSSVVLGAHIAHPSHLEEPIAQIGSRITIASNIDGEEKTLTLRVSGILTEMGSGVLSPDDQVLITLSTAQKLFETGNTISFLLIEVQEIESIDSVVGEINDKLGEGINVISSSFVLETIGRVTNTISTVLGGIAGISLIVAGVSIINTTIISILERTREIGVMMALGAKSRDVLLLFLIESSLTGLLGGVIGTIFGIVLSQFTSFIATSFLDISLPAVLSLEMILLGLVFAVLAGTIAGLYPAHKASKLHPVEALRYE